LLSRHTKPGKPVRRLNVYGVDIVHARTCRPSPHSHLESVHRVGIAFGDHFHAAVVLVANVALNAFTLRRILDEISKPDALHSASDDVPAPDKHAELYKVAWVA
jgi:hypothetical protein